MEPTDSASLGQAVSNTPLSSSPLLRLPRELRYEIYDHLCHQEAKSYPFRQPPIICIDQRAPPTALLTTCRYLNDEIHAYFHAKVTFTLHLKNVRRGSFTAMNAASIRAIRQAKKLHIILDWFRTQMQPEEHRYPLSPNMTCGLIALIEFLHSERISLELITVSVMDGLSTIDWDNKKKLLEPLHKLAGRVRFRVDRVVSEGDELDLETRLRDYMKRLNGVVLPASR